MRQDQLLVKILLTILMIAIRASLVYAQSTTVYSNNFEAGVGSQWTFSGGLSSSIDPFPGLSNTLGTFRSGTATLSLNALPAHSSVTVELDLYIEGSWDGNGNFGEARTYGNLELRVG